MLEEAAEARRGEGGDYKAATGRGLVEGKMGWLGRARWLGTPHRRYLNLPDVAHTVPSHRGPRATAARAQPWARLRQCERAKPGRCSPRCGGRLPRDSEPASTAEAAEHGPAPPQPSRLSPRRPPHAASASLLVLLLSPPRIVVASPLALALHVASSVRDPPLV